MTNKERKEKRYLRRKQKRKEKIITRSNHYGDLNNAFKFHKVLYYSDKCCNGVRWKKSTQVFMLHQFTIISNTCHNIKNNSYKVNKTFKFKINERGKVRDIDAPNIKDRLVHKVISNEILIPIYNPHLIYDNGASIKGKGFTFSLNRVKHMLIKFYKKYNKGYVVLIDYSNYFKNCSHELIHNIHNKYIINKYTIKVIEDYLFIDEGISLGVEIAQREAGIIPNILDHYIQNNNCMIERYMDDSIFFVENYNKAKLLLDNYIKLSNSINIVINKKKTKIINIKNKFKYCKWIFKFNNNKVIYYPIKDTIYRQRRKLRKMYKLNISINEINNTKNCFISYLNIENSYKYIKYLV